MLLRRSIIKESYLDHLYQMIAGYADIINNCSQMRLVMWKITCLLLALQTVAASFCSLVLPQQQMQAEMRQYALASQQLSGIFDEQKNLVADVLAFILNKPEYLTGVQKRLTASIKVYNNWVTTPILVLIVCLACGLIAKKIAKQYGQGPDKLVTLFSKSAKIIIAILCLSIFLFACAGISGGMKQKKSLNTILCMLFKEPKGMLRSSQQSQDFQAFDKHADEIDDHTLHNLEQYHKISNKLLGAKQAVRVSKIVMRELPAQINSSAFVTNFEQSFRDLEQTIKPSLVGLLSQIYEIKLYSINYAKIFKAVIKGVENYASRKDLHRLVSLYSSSVVGFYGLVLVASAALLILTVRNRHQNEALQSSLLPFMQYFLIMFLIICVLACLLTSILVPSFLWARQSKEHTLSSRPNFYEQMRQLGKTSPDIVDLAALIAPTNMTFSQIFDRRFQTQSAEVIRVISPYLAYNSSYFYDQLKQALNFIKDNTTREQVAILVEQKEVKQPYIASFKEYVTVRTQIIDTFRQEQAVNVGAFGKSLADFFEVFTVLMLNRSFQSHEISGRLIVCLTVLILLLFCFRKRRENAPNGHKKIEMDEQNGFSSDTSDMYVS